MTYGRPPGVHAVRITEHQKAELRSLYATGKFRLQDLAPKYGVSVSYVGAITRGKQKKLSVDTQLADLAARLGAIEAQLAAR